MSSMREITIILPVIEHAALAAVAVGAAVEVGKHAEGDAKRDALFFLNELVDRANWDRGPRGINRQSAVSFDGNYSHVDELIEALRPFWLELYAYRDERGGDLMEYDLNRVTILAQHEQEDATTIISLMVKEDGTIVIKETSINLEID